MRDYLTTLAIHEEEWNRRQRYACKRWVYADDKWDRDNYDLAEDYTHRRVAVDLTDGISGMLDVLQGLAGRSNTIAIHGALLPGRDPDGLVKRRGPKVTVKGPPWFGDANHLYQMFDLDGGTVWPMGRPARTQEEWVQAARHNWMLYAPGGLEDADVVVQLSNSAGFSDVFKAHYWVAMDQFTCNESWRRWVLRYKCEGLRVRIMDPAVHKATQPLYTANPLIRGGPDPLEGIDRVFFVEGRVRHGVPPGDVVDLEAMQQLDERKQPARKPRPPINATDEEIEAAILERLRESCSEIRNAGIGARHAAANQAAYTMGGWMQHSGAPTRGHIERELIDAAIGAGMPESRARDEVRRAMDDGGLRPMEIDGLVGAWRARNRTHEERRQKARQEPAPEAEETPAEERETEPAQTQEEWRQDLLRTDKGGIRNMQANVNTILAHDEEWRGILGFDLFRDRICVRAAPPWHGDDAPIDLSDRWDDETDPQRLQSWIARHYGFEPTIARSRSGALIAALRLGFHPIREYLDGLEWDGIERIDTWLEIYCGVDCEGESEAALRHCQYVRSVGRWWLISAVARIFVPGCKVDHVLVLEGDQGIKKSSTFQALMHDPSWFTDSHIEIGTKDSMLALRGKWIVEFSEFDGIISRKEAAAIKQFLTSDTDHYRKPYAAESADHPRQNVFGGSVNKEEYLRDETGNRRYWPVKASRVDLDSIRRDRDQLWAEAVAAFKRGDRWWPEDGEHDLMRDEQSERSVGDPWEQKIEEWVIDRNQIEVTDVLSGPLDMPGGHQEKRHQMRVVAILKALGFVRTRITLRGRRKWVYKRGLVSQPPKSGTV